MPGRGKRRQASNRRQLRRGHRHGPAEAVTDEGRRLADRVEQRQQQPLDMLGYAEIGAIGRKPPVDQQHLLTRCSKRGGERCLFVEVQHVRRIDQRGYEDDGRAIAAVIPQGCTGDSGNRGAFGARRRPRCGGIGFEPGKRVARHPRLALRDLAYQFEKQRQWSWRPPLLRCTIRRC